MTFKTPDWLSLVEFALDYVRPASTKNPKHVGLVECKLTVTNRSNKAFFLPRQSKMEELAKEAGLFNYTQLSSGFLLTTSQIRNKDVVSEVSFLTKPGYKAATKDTFITLLKSEIVKKTK